MRPHEFMRHLVSQLGQSRHIKLWKITQFRNLFITLSGHFPSFLSSALTILFNSITINMEHQLYGFMRPHEFMRLRLRHLRFAWVHAAIRPQWGILYLRPHELRSYTTQNTTVKKSPLFTSYLLTVNSIFAPTILPFS